MNESVPETDTAEVFGIYHNDQPVNVVRADEHREITAVADHRIRELRRLNEEKAETIRDLREKVEGAVAGEEKRRVHIINSIREGIIQFADEHDLDREFVNGLLEGHLDMEPLPEYVTAEIEVTMTVTFEAGSGVPSSPDPQWLAREVMVDSASVRPNWSSGLTVDEVEIHTERVASVETN